MTDPPTNYCAIPPLESRSYDDQEARINYEDPNEMEAWTPSEDLTKWTYALLGCATLLPWNTLTNGTSFFLSRLGDSWFYSTFSSYMSSVYTLTKLCCLLYCTITSRRSSLSRRIFTSLIATILFISSLFSSTFFQGTPSSFFAFGIFNAAALGVTTSYAYAAVYAQAALLDPSPLQSVLSGQAAIAVVISAVQVIGTMISLWSSPLKLVASETLKSMGGDHRTDDLAARIFFCVSSLFLCVTLATYTRLMRRLPHRLITGSSKRPGGVRDTASLTRPDHPEKSLVEEASYTYQVFKRHWVLFSSIAYVFTVTLAVYPAITVRVRPVNTSIHPLLFTAVHFLIFNLGDFVGRLGHPDTFLLPRFAWTTKRVLVASLLRTVFVPLILFSNVDRSGTTYASPPASMIGSDFYFMIILFGMGYTNGLVSCVAMLMVSSHNHSEEEGYVDFAATLGGMFQIVGLALGALSSFCVEAMIE